MQTKMNSKQNTNLLTAGLVTLASFLGAAALGTTGFASTAAAEPPKVAEGARNGADESTGLDGVININTASQTELMLLPGVGASRADAVIAARKQKSFEKAEDIMKVKGIGRATFRKLRAHLAVSGATTLRSLGAAKAASPAAGKPSKQ
jgi:competence protein ComEA